MGKTNWKKLVLARTAINSMDEYLKDTEIDEIEYIYLNGIYNSVKPIIVIYLFL